MSEAKGEDRTHLDILVVDDAPLVRSALAALLRHHGVGSVREACDEPSAIAAAHERPPSVVVMDVRLPPTLTTEGFEIAARLRDLCPQAGILMLSNHVEIRGLAELLKQSRSDVGTGYLLKERASGAGQLLQSIDAIVRGEVVIDDAVLEELTHDETTKAQYHSLTDREQEVLEAMARGFSNRSIAGQLAMSERTVESHVSALMNKLGIAVEDHTNRRVRAVLTHLRYSRVHQG